MGGAFGLEWEVDDPSSMVPEILRGPGLMGLNDGGWHHVAATWQPGLMVIYVDGSEQARRTSTSQSINPATATAFMIGGEQGTPFSYTGSIDEPMLFNRAITATEVASCVPPVTNLALSVGFGSSNTVTAIWSAPSTSVGSPINTYTAVASAPGWVGQTRTVSGATTATFDNVPYLSSITVQVVGSDGVRSSIPVMSTITSGDSARPTNISTGTVDTSTVAVNFSLTRSIGGTTCSVYLNGSPQSIGCTGGNIGGLAAGTTYSVTVRASGPSGTYDVAGPNVSTATPPPTPTVNLAKGPSAPFGFRYAVTLSSFPANSNVTVTCHDSVDPAGFYTFTMRTDGAGNAFVNNQCYSGDHPDHWVYANGYRSNTVSW
jgi:hypothetical protein